MLALLRPATPHPLHFGGPFRALRPARMGTLLMIGLFFSSIDIASAGQLLQGPADSRQPPATLQQKPGSPLITKEERKPYDWLSLQSAVKSRLQQEIEKKKGPFLLDAVPAPTRKSGPCGLVFLDERRDIDPRMIVPVPPGDFAIRKAIPEICNKD